MEETAKTPSKYNFTKKDILTVPKRVLINGTTTEALYTSDQEDCTLEEGIEIGDALLKFLEQDKSGIGVSAIQFGIIKKVCAIRVKEPIILVNPTIEFLPEGIDFPYIEGCLSLPETLLKTKRWSNIKISALNLGDNFLYSDVTHLIKEGYMKSMEVLEMVAVQHEIDHLNGILMDDHTRKWVNIPYRNLMEKIGRNTIVKATNRTSGEVITVKFKKIEGDKDWVITPLS